LFSARQLNSFHPAGSGARQAGSGQAGESVCASVQGLSVRLSRRRRAQQRQRMQRCRQRPQRQQRQQWASGAQGNRGAGLGVQYRRAICSSTCMSSTTGERPGQFYGARAGPCGVCARVAPWAPVWCQPVNARCLWNLWLVLSHCLIAPFYSFRPLPLLPLPLPPRQWD
jgi:hypothetical protein